MATRTDPTRKDDFGCADRVPFSKALNTNPDFGPHAGVA